MAKKAILVAIVLTMLMVGSAAPLASGAPAREKYVMVTFIAAGEFWTYCFAGMKDAAAILDVDVSMQGVAEWSGVDQAALVDQVIGSKPSGLLITAADADALRPSIGRAMAAGIPVVCFDTDSPKSTRLAFVGTNNYESGRTAGAALGKMMGGKGKVGILTVVGPLHLAQRVKGIQDVLAEQFPDIKVVSIQDDKSQPEISMNLTVNMLQAHPDLKAIVSSHGQGAVGIAPGVRQTGKRPGKDVIVTGWDFSKETLDLIDKGEVNFTVAQNPYAMGYWALLVAYTKNHPAEGRRKGTLIPSQIDTGVIVVTKENTQDWR